MAQLSDAPPTDIDPYQTLEIETTATPSEVKSAYKKLALQHHPGNLNPRDLASDNMLTHDFRQSSS